MPHEFDYHIQLHKDNAPNHQPERNFLKKQEPHFAIIPYQVPMSSYAASSRQPSIGGQSQQSSKVLSHRSHSQHQIHLSGYSHQSEKHPPNVMVFPNIARSAVSSQHSMPHSLGVQSSSFKVVEPSPHLHVSGSLANSGMRS